jgi:hypothetical protein
LARAPLADRRQSAIVICGHLMLEFADPAKRTHGTGLLGRHRQ